MTDLLRCGSAEDRRWFHPFAVEEDVIAKLIEDAESDLYVGWQNAGNMVALSMLRGLDEGYASPMYGVFVSPNYRRLGIAKMTLQHAVTVSKLMRYPSVMLKVHDDNLAAADLYRHAGFRSAGRKDGQLFYMLELSCDKEKNTGRHETSKGEQ